MHLPQRGSYNDRMKNLEFLTVREVADRLGLDPRTVRQRARDQWKGFPPLIELGPKSQRISAKELDQWIAASQRQENWL